MNKSYNNRSWLENHKNNTFTNKNTNTKISKTNQNNVKFFLNNKNVLSTFVPSTFSIKYYLNFIFYLVIVKLIYASTIQLVKVELYTQDSNQFHCEL